MKVEIDLAGGIKATIKDGRWTCDAKGLIRGVGAVSGRVFESPSVGDLDYARATAVANEFGGTILTPEPMDDSEPRRVY